MTLALAGGVPTSFPHESPEGRLHELSITDDPQIRALILLAPAWVWFRERMRRRG